MQTRVADVLVLGGGVIGLSCAWSLLREGRSVTVLDQAAVGSGSSHGNCGTLTPSHAMPLATPGVLAQALRWLPKRDAPLRIQPRLDMDLLRWLFGFAGRCNGRAMRRATLAKAPLLLRSRAMIEDLVRTQSLDCEFGSTGTLNVFRDERNFEQSRQSLALLAEAGVKAEVWDATTLLAREPALKPGVVGALFNPGDAMLRPDRYVAELARVVRANGGCIEENTRVDGIVREGSRITSVSTSHGAFRGREVVLALGAWSPRLARQLGLRIPIQPGKGYSITYTRPVLCPGRPLTLREPSVCVTAWESGFRLGSTMEFAGYDTSLNRTRLDALRRGAAAFLHEPEGPVRIEEWYGWRPMTPDDMPLIGRTRRFDNLLLATGHGMLGVSLSAVTGDLVADILSGRSAAFDLNSFAPDRFA